MSQRNCDVHLSQSLVRSLLDYDPETGQLTWKARPLGDFYDEKSCQAWNAQRAGQPAGSRPPRPKIRINGRNYPPKTVAFIWMTGCAPRGIVKPRSGDPHDLRWDSIRHAVEDGPTNDDNTVKPSGDPQGPSGYQLSDLSTEESAGTEGVLCTSSS